jgi:repressor LexA
VLDIVERVFEDAAMYTTGEDVGRAARRVYDEMVASGPGLSVRDLAGRLGLAPSTVKFHLATLKGAGWADSPPGQARSWRVVGGPAMARSQVFDLSEFAVSAGLPTATGAIDDALAGSGLTDGDQFQIRASGQSMIGAGILDGDLLTFRVQSSADLRAIVLAVVPDDDDPALRRATVKRLARSTGGRLVLLPENPAYEPIVPESMWILGRLIKVERDY